MGAEAWAPILPPEWVWMMDLDAKLGALVEALLDLFFFCLGIHI
jgi:hypothetical protein